MEEITKIEIEKISARLEERFDCKTQSRKFKCVAIIMKDTLGEKYNVSTDNIRARKLLKNYIILPKTLPSSYAYKVSINTATGENRYSIGEEDCSNYFKSNLTLDEFEQTITRFKQSLSQESETNL